MSRTDIPVNIQTAADHDSINAAVSAIIFKTRQFFEYADLTLSATSFANPDIISDTPVGQDVKWSERSYDIYTLYADSDILKLETASSGLQSLDNAGSPLDTHDKYRPALWTMVSGEQVYFSNDTSGIFYAELTGYTVSGSSNIVSSATSAGAWWQRNSPIAIHAVDDQEAICFWIDDGGLSCSYIYYSGGWQVDDWEFRYIDPINVMTTGDATDNWNVHYSAAVKNAAGDIHIFLTRWDGSVDVLIRHANAISIQVY
jgi:hypothetical protein